MAKGIRAALEEIFRFHPFGQTIVERMLSETCDQLQVNEWMEEAEYYTAHFLMKNLDEATEDLEAPKGTHFMLYKGGVRSVRDIVEDL